MIRLALTALAIAVAFVAGGRTTYSALQQQVPIGTAFKFAPDPANIWSWHDSVMTTPGTVRLPVMIDFDRDGKMDTQHSGVRVLVTDMQVVLPSSGDGNFFYAVQAVRLVDSTGLRWNLTPRQVPLFKASNLAESVHLSTPLVLPVGSDLHIEVDNFSAHQTGGQPLTITLLGRVVTL